MCKQLVPAARGFLKKYPLTPSSCSGSVFLAMFAAIAMVGLVGFAATNVMKGPIATMQVVTKRTIAEDNISTSGKLAVVNTLSQADGGDCDADGLVEPTAWSTSGTGTAPAGGGFLPAGLGVGMSDPWGRTYGYCVWDHGSAIRTGVCPSDDRLSGNAGGTGMLVAVISSGPDKIFQTSCANAPTFLQKVAGSDDIVSSYTYAEAQKAAGGLWNLKSSDNTIAEIGKKLEVKNTGGTVTFALDSETGAGTFKGVTTGGLTGFSTDPVEMSSGLQLASETDAADVGCIPADVGMLRYHSTSGMQVCNGTAYVAVGGGGGGAGYLYRGQFEGKISAGWKSSCALRPDGAAYCWGMNAYGQLGDGTTTTSSVPVAVSGGHKFVRITTNAHTCGLRSDGAAYCWGYNNKGQLGDGSTTNRSVPTAVTGGHKFLQLAVGSSSTCGIRTDGAAYCWGFNFGGVLGDGTTIDRLAPTAVTGGHKFVQISAGTSQTCALKADGSAYCWGYNTQGQLGDGTTTNRISGPVAVIGGHKFVSITTSDSVSCGIRTDGAAYCWGYNFSGDLGDGTTTNSSVPVAVSGGHTFVKLERGSQRTCGIRADGAALCWGYNPKGQLGDGTTTSKYVPTEVLGGHSFAQISPGSFHVCGLHADGSVYCWGDNQYKQFGDGTTTDSSIPANVSLTNGFSTTDLQGNPFQFGDGAPTCNSTTAGTVNYSSGSLNLCDGAASTALGAKTGQYNYSGQFEGKISAGYNSSCGIRSDGAAYCWGANTQNQLGDGTATQRTSPVAVVGGHKFVQVTVGGNYYACGLRIDGAVYCWGYNASGQLGDGTTTTRTSPVAVSGGHTFVQINGSGSTVCGIRTDGAAYCWGDGTAGQLGDGTTVSKSVPTAVGGGHKFAQISSGGSTICGIRTDGAAYCWGSNLYGQVGDGTTLAKSSPTAVAGNYKFAQISLGFSYACGIRTDGVAYCWGQNTNGKLGNGTTTDSTALVAVTGGHKFAQISTSSDFACGIRTDGTAYCWGLNTNGQLGDGTTVSKSVPTIVSGGYRFAQIRAGLGSHTCGIRPDGGVYCWGLNTNGQLGDATTVQKTIPTHVPTFSMADVQGRSYQFANDNTACGSDNVGTVRYDSAGSPAWQYCNGTAWVQFGPAGAALPWDSKTLVGGSNFGCALRSDGAAYCWGYNSNGNLGDGTTTNQSRPTLVTGGLTFTQLTAGQAHACGLVASGAAYCWGNNANGAGGNGTTTSGSVPVAVIGGHTFTSISAGGAFTCGLRTDGAAYCWGYNLDGRLGDGTLVNKTSPTAVAGGQTFIQVVASNTYGCGLRADGAAYCWGVNTYGQLGNGTTTTSTSPVAVGGGHKFVQLSSAFMHVCGLRADGAAYCWGNNTYGQFGNGTTAVNNTSPVAVGGGHKFKEISAGGNMTCGLRVDGAAYCFGRNSESTVGDGTTTQRTSPTAVSGGHTFVKLIIAYSGIACGIRTDGALYCWGDNQFGQTGDGTTTTPRNIPTAAVSP